RRARARRRRQPQRRHGQHHRDPDPGRRVARPGREPGYVDRSTSIGAIVLERIAGTEQTAIAKTARPAVPMARAAASTVPVPNTTLRTSMPLSHEKPRPIADPATT